MNDLEIENALQEKGLNAPRLNPTHIESVIVDEQYHRLTDTLTVCVLTLKNGYTVTGESACVSAENYNEEIGNSIARKNAADKVWALEGYVLKTLTQIPHKEDSVLDRVKAEAKDLSEKMQKLSVFLYNEEAAVEVAGERQVSLLKSQLSTMNIYLELLESRIEDLSKE